MIDFKNTAFQKLKPAKDTYFQDLVVPMLVNGETVICAYQCLLDGVVFTSKRIITVNIQTITRKKKDITSLPYSKIQAFSVETAGDFDWDSELELWFSGLGKVKLEFTAKANVAEICRMISEHVL